MGQKFLIDTNVIIDYTSNLFNNTASTYVENIFNTDFNISIIVKIEVLGYKDLPLKMQMLEDFIGTSTVYSLDDAVTQKTIDLRRIRKIKLGDAIIASTAVVYDLTLLTRNLNDFKNIIGLTVINPHLL